jgi:tRNA nucleotidyltransferase/poly(A) polymerase
MALKAVGKNKNGTLDFSLIDLYKGQEDIKKKVLRAVGDPGERFSEDALRMMRAVRIAAEIGFSIEEATQEAIKKNAKLIDKISAERVRDEFLKTLASPNPDHGIMLLKESGILHEIFPELEENFGVPQASPGRHHIYDVGTHSLYSLKYVAEKNSDPIVRFATLIHDVGKAKTFKKLENGTITFYNHEMVSAKVAKAFAERIRLSNRDKDKLWKLVRFHQFTLDEKQTDSAIRRFIRNVGKENIKDMLDLRVGDRLGGGARETSWRLEEFKSRITEVQKQPFSVSDLKVTGYDVMKTLKVDSGPRVGLVLGQMFSDVVAGKLKNTKEELQKRLVEISKEKVE